MAGDWTMDVKSFISRNFFSTLLVFCTILISSNSFASDNNSFTNSNAIFATNLVLTESGSSSIFPPGYKLKQLDETVSLNGEIVSSGRIEYNPSGNVTRLERREKNRKGESITRVYRDESGNWIKRINWLIDGKESDVGKVVIEYLFDEQGRIVSSRLLNSVWAREYIYNDNQQLTEVIEKQILDENNFSEVTYPVRRYHYNSQGFIARRDVLTKRKNLISTHYFDYGEHNVLQRVTGIASNDEVKRNSGEKHYSDYDRYHNWLLAEWDNGESKFTKIRKIIYY